MKNIRELTDEQVTEIARLALQDEINYWWINATIKLKSL